VVAANRRGLEGVGGGTGSGSGSGAAPAVLPGQGLPGGGLPSLHPPLSGGGASSGAGGGGGDGAGLGRLTVAGGEDALSFSEGQAYTDRDFAVYFQQAMGSGGTAPAGGATPGGGGLPGTPLHGSLPGPAPSVSPAASAGGGAVGGGPSGPGGGEGGGMGSGAGSGGMGDLMLDTGVPAGEGFASPVGGAAAPSSPPASLAPHGGGPAPLPRRDKPLSATPAGGAAAADDSGGESVSGAASFADVIFVVEGKRIALHKAILAARCAYFQVMFSSRWAAGGSGAGRHGSIANFAAEGDAPASTSPTESAMFGVTVGSHGEVEATSSSTSSGSGSMLERERDSGLLVLPLEEVSLHTFWQVGGRGVGGGMWMVWMGVLATACESAALAPPAAAAPPSCAQVCHYLYTDALPPTFDVGEHALELLEQVRA